MDCLCLLVGAFIMEIEIWKPIKNYEGLYEVSNFGNVKSVFRYKKKLKNVLDNGYFYVGLYKNKKSNKIAAHILIAKAFIPNPENKPQINHINCIKTDNRIENLEWCTAKENTIHALKNNLLIIPKGELNGMSKLNNESVNIIRNKQNKISRKKLSEMFGISIKHVSRIRAKERWKHI